jgi:hypothetical protein
MHGSYALTSRDAAAERLRWKSKLLLLAILPTLTFLGHWPALTLNVPGLALSLTIPFVSEETLDHAAAISGPVVSSGTDAQEHTQHCHANVATCTDIPFTGGSAFALIGEAVAFLGAAAILVALSMRPWRPTHESAVPPELMPPRISFSAI